MKYDSLECQSTEFDVGVYECEVHLKFRLIEERSAFSDRRKLLEILLDAFTYGADDYMEPLDVNVDAQEVPEFEASPQMRRRLIRLRNSKDVD